MQAKRKKMNILQTSNQITALFNVLRTMKDISKSYLEATLIKQQISRKDGKRNNCFILCVVIQLISMKFFRYCVVRLLGSGVYGRVVECKDLAHKSATVAVKITRRGFPLYDQSARKEISILRDLKGQHGTPLLLRDFVHSAHICMCFNFLGENLKSAIAR